jgi:uncharacterized membrane protein YdjX (TVP38/TMEM64 family)
MNKKLFIVCILTIIASWVTFSHIDWLNHIQAIILNAGAWGDVIFVVAYAIATLLILPVTAFNIAGGAIYGGGEGLLLTSLGALLSAFLGFILARSLGTKFFNDDQWSNVNQKLVSGGLAYSFASRLLPLIPYGIVSFAAGLSPIKLRDYLLGTLFGTPLGIAPFVFLGSTGVKVTFKHDLLPLLASSMGLAILVILGALYKQKDLSPVQEEIIKGDYAEFTE